MKKTLIGLGLVVVIGAVLFVSLSGSHESGVGVDVQPASKMTISRLVKASGEIEPTKQVQISAKVGGEIVDLPVVEGQMVKKGQVLAQIERDIYKAARDQAKAALQQAQIGVQRAQASLADADRNLRLISELYKGQHVSQNDYDQAVYKDDLAKVDLASQQQAVQQQRYALDRAQENLAQTTIEAPMAGKIVRLDVEQGESVVPGTMNLPGSKMMTIADMSRLEAQVDVNEIDIPEVKVGQLTHVHVDALGDKVIDGHVIDIASSGDKDATGVVRFKVKIALDHPNPALRPAMTAKVDIVTAVHRDVVAVPIQAVVKRTLDKNGKEVSSANAGAAADTNVVYLAKGGKAVLEKVTTGISDELHVEVKKGLAVDAPVIVGPYKTLKAMRSGEALHVAKTNKPIPPKPEAVAKSHVVKVEAN